MSLRGNDEEKDQDMPFSWQDFQRLLECTTSEDSLVRDTTSWWYCFIRPTLSHLVLNLPLPFDLQIPDNIVDYFIGKAGCTVTDPNVYVFANKNLMNHFSNDSHSILINLLRLAPHSWFFILLYSYRMISLSTHKFLHDLIVSARRYQDKGRPQTGQLRAESLLAALAAKGLVVNKIDFLAGN